MPGVKVFFIAPGDNPHRRRQNDEPTQDNPSSLPPHRADGPHGKRHRRPGRHVLRLPHGPGHELLLLLVFRQDRPEDVRRPRDRRARPSRLLRHGPPAGHSGRPADAEGLHHPVREPQRLRHRPEPQPRRGRRHRRDSAHSHPRRNWRGSWPTNSPTSRTATS